MTAWKEFERKVARLVGGKRFWANSGEAIDVESDDCVVQCKLVGRMSLGELTRLAQVAEAQGRAKGKVGLVAVKFRAGRGHETPTLLVVTESAMAGKCERCEGRGWTEERNGDDDYCKEPCEECS